MWGLPLVLFGFAIFIRPAQSADIKLCSKDDKGCLIKVVNMMCQQAIKGNPVLNIESLDPLYYEEVDGDIATLKYKLFKSNTKGMKDCTVVDVGVSDDQSALHIEMKCPFFDMQGTYEMDGKILTLPIRGKGDYVMECKDYTLVLDGELKIIENDNKKYAQIKKYTYSAELQGGMIHMNNLFNGQKELADAVLKVMNENWVAVSKELQGPVIKATLIKIVKNVNKLFKLNNISTLIA